MDPDLIIDEIMACVEDRDEVRLYNFLHENRTHRFCPIWNIYIGLLANLREKRPEDFNWLAWVVSGYASYKAIVNDYFLYIYDRREKSIKELINQPYSFEQLN